MFRRTFARWLGRASVYLRQVARKRNSFVPRLDVLEDRLAPALLIVNTLADEVVKDSHLSLREAVQVVDGTLKINKLSLAEQAQITGTLGSNDTIKIEPGGLSSSGAMTINLSAGELLITKSVTIENPNNLPLDPRLVISGTNASRIFEVASGVSVTLSSLTLEGGLARGSGAAAQGGAIYNQGNLTLLDMILQNNTARGGDGADGTSQFYAGGAGQAAAGGAIWSSGTLMLDSGTQILNNQAVGGGGGTGYTVAGTLKSYQKQSYIGGAGGAGGSALGGGVYVGGGTVAVDGATISGNAALGGQGGAAGAGGPGGAGGAAGNGLGGGICVVGGAITLTGATLSRNTAQGGAGGAGGGLGPGWGGIPEFGPGTLNPGGRGGDGRGGGLALVGGSTTLIGGTLDYNTAQGGAGGHGGIIFLGGPSNGNGGDGGAGTGGALDVANQASATLRGSLLDYNMVQGGVGGNGTFYGGAGGNGFGGGIHVSGGTAELDPVTMQFNSAQGGAGGVVTSTLYSASGSAGLGTGGGLNLEGGATCLNTLTLVSGNTASTSNGDVFGSFTICP
jgi:hypothetical protein